MGQWIPVSGKDVFIHYGNKRYSFNDFDGWFIGPIGEYVLGITTPGTLTIFEISLIFYYRYRYYLEMNPTMIERNNESAKLWKRYDINYKKLKNGYEAKIKICKIK